MRLRGLYSSLRARLIASTGLLQVIMLALMTLSGLSILQEQLLTQSRIRVQELNVLLNAALSGPLAQMDYAVLGDLLDAIRSEHGLTYLWVYDSQGKLAAVSGESQAPLALQVDADLNHSGSDGLYDAALPITLAGQRLGELRYGLSIGFLSLARQSALNQSLLIAGGVLLMSLLILTGLGIWLTRHLRRLTSAAESVASGHYDVRLPASGTDEVGRLVKAFNRMAESLQMREKELHESQNHLIFLAERDSLTGLYNRHYFRRELERRLDEARRENTQGALLLFDLDEFKLINDTYGHQTGDELLVRVAHTVGRLVRRHEVFCRLGGDEFVIILPMASESQATALAQRVVGALAAMPFAVEGAQRRLSGSLGIALYPGHAEDPETLLARADSAMYQAKQAGKNAWRLFEPEADTTQSLVDALNWKDRISQALEQGGLELAFQGIYAMPERRLVHLEALVRMRDRETGGLIPPGQFIPVAEKSGQILAIDRWVIGECARRLGAHAGMPKLAINVSGRSFDEPDMPDYIAARLAEHGVAADRLIVEVTETAAVSDLEDAERFIQRLRQIGCPICLDDFGAGFASFAYLKHMQADTIKIDGLFIRHLPDDVQNQIFVRAMVEVARGLKVNTIAECVEDEATLRMLGDFGVNMVQGYHLDRPRIDHPACVAYG